MENVCLRLDRQLSSQIEKDMKEFKYSTKTEFIREAIRKMLRENSQERAKRKAWAVLFKMKGALKGKSKFKNYEEWHDWRSNEGSKALEEQFQKELGLKN